MGGPWPTHFSVDDFQDHQHVDFQNMISDDAFHFYIYKLPINRLSGHFYICQTPRQNLEHATNPRTHISTLPPYIPPCHPPILAGEDEGEGILEDGQVQLQRIALGDAALLGRGQ